MESEENNRKSNQVNNRALALGVGIGMLAGAGVGVIVSTFGATMTNTLVWLLPACSGVGLTIGLTVGLLLSKRQN